MINEVRTAVSIIVALALHIAAGWPWSIGGGMVAGWLTPRGGWWRGAVAVGTGWAILIAYNLVVAFQPVSEMHRVVGEVAGGLPAWTIPVVSVLAGTAIGAAGGLVGSSVHRIAGARNAAART